MLQVDMAASVRTETGKGAMRRLRDKGQTPAVVYGKGKDAQSLQMDSKTLMATLLEVYRHNCVVTLNVDDGSQRHVVIKDVQTDPVTDTLVHADFCEIDLEKAQRFEVPVEYTGKAKGVDLGGVLTINSSNVVLKGRPLDIPNGCSLDVTGLNIGDELTFSAITLPENVELLSPADAVCVSVVK